MHPTQLTDDQLIEDKNASHEKVWSSLPVTHIYAIFKCTPQPHRGRVTEVNILEESLAELNVYLEC